VPVAEPGTVSIREIMRTLLIDIASETAEKTDSRTEKRLTGWAAIPTTTVILGDGAPVTGFIYHNDSIVSKIVVHTSQNGEIQCPYIEPTGSGSVYISCCRSMASSWRDYFDRTAFPLPKGLAVQTVCPGGMTYATTKSTTTATATASEHRVSSLTEEIRRLYRTQLARTFENDEYITKSAIVDHGEPETKEITFPTPSFTEFPCGVPYSICKEWKSSEMAGIETEKSVDLVERLASLREGLENGYLCNQRKFRRKPGPHPTWTGSIVDTLKPLVTWTRESTPPPEALGGPCTLLGNQVTVYYYASKKARRPEKDVCDYRTPSIFNGLDLISEVKGKFSSIAINRVLIGFEIGNDTLSRHANVSSQIIPLPVTSWGPWSTVKSCSSGDFKTTTDCFNTIRREATISYTEVPMYEDKIYLHYDRLDVQRFAPTDNPVGEDYYRSWTSFMTAAILEIDTSELSTWNSRTLEAVTLASWEWPYKTRDWAGFCPYGKCATIIEGKFEPAIMFPKRITEVYPELKGCVVDNQWYGKSCYFLLLLMIYEQFLLTILKRQRIRKGSWHQQLRLQMENHARRCLHFIGLVCTITLLSQVLLFGVQTRLRQELR
jgi:hypothetical protein